ncbi:MAG TPA: TrbG/VirB9 family P-type conjugative transfer protein [Longimicrobiaceae bacterium]|nr:TrbG/VirB9 family P-type conjugative transfer protein [Longimicrobiaceae bacterium]
MNPNPCLRLALVLSALAPAPLAAQGAAVREPPRLLGTVAVHRPDALERAALEFKTTGRAHTLLPERPGDFTAFPYGYARPYLRCAALKLCQVELQPGETLADEPLPGDRERWDVDRTTSGGLTVVLVKPKECDVSTNLVIPTDRRRYVVELEAPPCKGTNPRGGYMDGIRFWYPDEVLAAGRGPAASARRDAILVDVRAVNTEYRWDRNRRLSWTPLRVLDDGKRTFIQFAPAARDGEMPVLYAVAEDGTRELVNTVARPDPAGDYLVADRVLRRAVLVLREGKRERKLDVVNLALRRKGR